MTKSTVAPAVDRFDRMGHEELLAWAANPTIDSELLARQPDDYHRDHLKERVRGLVDLAKRKSQEHGIGSDAELTYLQAARRVAETGVLWRLLENAVR